MALITSDCSGCRGLGVTAWFESAAADLSAPWQYPTGWGDLFRRRECGQFADIPSPSILKHLLKGEEGAAE